MVKASGPAGRCTATAFNGFRGERALFVQRCDGERPVATILLVHGGGFVSGSPDAMSAAAVRLAERLASVVLIPAYTLAADAPFPAAAEDVYAALLWAATHAAEGRWSGTRLVIVGVEAGGNLAAAAAMMARDRGGPPLVAQILVRPMLDPSQSSRSMRDCAAAESLRCRSAYRAYLACSADQLHPYAAPLASVRLAGLPAALILTAEDDPLRDEADAYAANLIRAGVTTQVSRLPHAEQCAAWDAATLDAIAAFVGPRIAAARHKNTPTNTPESTP